MFSVGTGEPHVLRLVVRSLGVVLIGLGVKPAWCGPGVSSSNPTANLGGSQEN